MSDYDPMDDALKSWELAIAEIRKRAVREGREAPLPDRPEEMAIAPKPDDKERFA